MCGICGIVHVDSDRQVNPDILEKMAYVVGHRGPDDEGFYENKNVGLGHKRLSIIDLAEGHQPMSNEDSSVWIVFNGEIYNYLGLRDDLIKAGHSFKTRSDTETIVHAYEEYGEKCVDKLRGMFAFAIWDQKRQQLFAARDRVGKKPFYYAISDRSFIFGSEIKSILQYPGCKREVSLPALNLYLSMRYVPGPQTMFAGIMRLQPGEYMTLSDGRLTTAKYWDVSATAQNGAKTIEDYFETFYALISESIRMRLMSEVPLGVFLSGGIDSSFVVALMSSMVNTRIKTFSVGYESDYGTNEFEYARMVAKRYKTEHYELRIKSQDFFEFLPRLVWYLDEPIADPATIPLYFLSEYAKHWITVILSGEGADEILAGYYIYNKMLWISRYQRLPHWMREHLFSRVAGVLARKKDQKKYLEMSRLPLVERYHGVSTGFSKEMKEKLFRWPDTSNKQSDALFRCYYQDVSGWSDLNKMLYADLKVWLPDDLLMKADKMTMAASMELRVPFLDHKLVEFAFSLPAGLKVNGNTTKYLLREISKKYIPDAIVKRAKKGFPVPLSEWLAKDLRQVANEALLVSGSACRRYFEPSVVREIIRKQTKGEDDLSQEIWNLLVFEFWHRAFVGNSD